MSKTAKVLEVVEKSADVKVAVQFDPKDYFKNREGLYVWSSFNDRVLDKAQAVKESEDIKVSSFKLLEDSTDEEIEAALPKEHLFTETQVCAVIASLIEKQPKGEEGTLLNDGYANLFYTGAFVVRVRWYAGGWRVGAWHRDDDWWHAGDRVFSPAN